jgi:hypothetical protein
MNLLAELAMMQAVAELVRMAPMNGKVSIEMTGEIPVLESDVFCAVMPGGVTPGRYSDNGNTIEDYQVAVKVAVYCKCGTIPRDERGNPAVLHLTRLAQVLTWISQKVSWNYAVAKQAGEKAAAMGLTGEFTRPLIPTAMDQMPQLVTAGEWDGVRAQKPGTDEWVGVKRSITFGRAEWRDKR